MENLSFLIKPVSYRCNLKCHYCFYERVGDLYDDGAAMATETLDAIMRSAFGSGARHCNFIWQGGEPTLMGLDFYREAARLQKSLARPDQVAENAFQTNGILLNDEWGRFFAEESAWLVGVSLDGPEEIHDRYRCFHNQAGSFQKVMGTIARLRSHGVPFNILTLLTNINIRHADKVWNFFMKNRFTHLQFINCFELDSDTGSLAEFSVNGKDVGKFYCAVFDRWMKEGIPKVSIRLFEDMLIYRFHRRHVSCCFMEKCDSYLVVEHNGDCYPCDFFVYPEWKLGNIVADGLDSVLANPLRKDFAHMKSDLPEKCNNCNLLGFCRGDCTKFRQGPGRGYDQASAYCEALQTLSAHMEPRLPEIARYVRRIEEGTAGRNDPCPCGSGKKYKKCCGL